MNEYYQSGYDFMRGILDATWIQYGAFVVPFFALRWVLGFFNKLHSSVKGGSYKSLDREAEDVRTGFERWRK